MIAFAGKARAAKWLHNKAERRRIKEEKAYHAAIQAAIQATAALAPLGTPVPREPALNDTNEPRSEPLSKALTQGPDSDESTTPNTANKAPQYNLLVTSPKGTVRDLTDQVPTTSNQHRRTPPQFQFSPHAPSFYPALSRIFGHLADSSTRPSVGTQDIRALYPIEMFPAGHQQPYGPQAPYVQIPAHDQSTYGRNAYAQPYAHENQQSFYQQGQYDHHKTPNALPTAQSGQQHSEYNGHGNARTAARMPQAVKGTPSYDVRMAVMQSQANEAFLAEFYNWTAQDQQKYLDRHFGAVEALNTSAYDRPSGAENQPPVVYSEQAAVVLRDPAPYTGYGAGNKVVEIGQSASPRTVLHDPVAHHAANQSTSTASTSTVKAQVSDSTPLHDQRLQPAQTQSAQNLQDPLESSVALPSTHEADDSTSPTYHTAPSTSPGSYHSAQSYNRFIDALERLKKPDALDRHIAHIQEVHDMLEARDSLQSGIPHAEHHEAHAIALDSTQSNTATAPTLSNTATDARQSGASPQMPQIKYTATGHPIPHGGFADFKTPYNKHFMGHWKDFPEPFASIAARVAQLEFHQEQQKKDPNAELIKEAEWFRATPSAKDLEQQTIIAELKARSAQTFANRITPRATAAGTAKPLPKPIGHERAVAAMKSAGTTSVGTTSVGTTSVSTTSVGTTSVTTSDVMTNPTAQDGIDLMSGTIANLTGYANGKDIGGHFANWTRPAEHAIDKSSDGNKSVFDKNWGSPPARVGRDPRYQQTMTTDGRATYFEDPARGMGRQ